LLRFWWEILFAINIVNVSLQNSQLSLNRACTLIKGLEGSLNKIRDNFDETIVNAIKPIAQALNITDRLKEKRVRKAKRQSDEIADDEARSLTALQTFRQECFLVLDHVVAEMTKRFEAMKKIATNFKMIIPKPLSAADVEEISSSVKNLCGLYKDDFDSVDLNKELSALRNWLPTILDEDPETADPLQLLNAILNYGMQSAFVNVCIAIRIFLTMPVTVASAERSFNKLKLVKNYLRSTMKLERISSLAIMFIEYDTAKSIDYSHIIDQFAQAKARKVKL
jgi:hAT family C-terminal dimerisation region